MTDKLAQRCRCLLIARPHYVGDHEQDAPPATVTIEYASGRKYRFEVRDETDADDLLHILTRTWAPIFTPLP